MTGTAWVRPLSSTVASTAPCGLAANAARSAGVIALLGLRTGVGEAALRFFVDICGQWTLGGGIQVFLQMRGVPRADDSRRQIRQREREAQRELYAAHAIEKVVEFRAFPAVLHGKAL